MHRIHLGDTWKFRQANNYNDFYDHSDQSIAVELPDRRSSAVCIKFRIDTPKKNATFFIVGGEPGWSKIRNTVAVKFASRKRCHQILVSKPFVEILLAS